MESLGVQEVCSRQEYGVQGLQAVMCALRKPTTLECSTGNRQMYLVGRCTSGRPCERSDGTLRGFLLPALDGMSVRYERVEVGN